MASVITVTNFTGGEISPKYLGRFDLAVHQISAQVLENWAIMSQGGVTIFPGSRYLGSNKSDGKARYYKFIISNSLKYELEFGANYIRFWKNDELVEDEGPIEANTTYSVTDIFELQFLQSYNALIIVHRDHPPKVLTWTGGDSFTFANISFTVNTEDLDGNPVEGPMQSENNYPGCIGSWQGRVVYGSSTYEPNTFWVSIPFAYDDMTYFETIEYTSTQLTDPDTWADPTVAETEEVTTEKNVIGDGNAFTAELNSEFNDQIMWLHSFRGADGLVIGTLSAEWVMSNDSTALAPEADVNSANGCALHPALLANEALVYVQGSNTRLREFRNLGDYGNDSLDLTHFADHILSEGVVQYDVMREPEPSVWCVLGDGSLAILLLNKPLSIQGWFRVKYPNATVESISISRGTGKDDVYLSMKIDNHRYRVKVDPYFSDFCVDCGIEVVKSGDTVSGLDHLEGKTVYVVYYVGNNGYFVSKEVNDGDIDLSGEEISDGTTLYIGLKHTATGKSMPLSTSSGYGLGQTFKKRIGPVNSRILNTYSLKVGYEEDDVQHLESALISEKTTGDIEVPAPADWTREGSILFVQDEPLPATVLCFVAGVDG